MSTIAHSRKAPGLRADEREIVFTIADDERSWHVHTDSRRAASTRLLRVARALGITPERTGFGWTFALPLAAVSFRVPRRASLAQREVLLEARLRPAEPLATGVSRGPGPRGVP